MILATTWIKFWETVLMIGFGSFALLVLIVIPLGARDILRLFKKLDGKSLQQEEPQD
jgi:hypothetical protein